MPSTSQQFPNLTQINIPEEDNEDDDDDIGQEAPKGVYNALTEPTTSRKPIIYSFPIPGFSAGANNTKNVLSKLFNKNKK